MIGPRSPCEAIGTPRIRHAIAARVCSRGETWGGLLATEDEAAKVPAVSGWKLQQGGQ
jgi:hypothetical protein